MLLFSLVLERRCVSMSVLLQFVVSSATNNDSAGGGFSCRGSSFVVGGSVDALLFTYPVFSALGVDSGVSSIGNDNDVAG